MSDLFQCGQTVASRNSQRWHIVQQVLLTSEYHLLPLKPMTAARVELTLSEISKLDQVQFLVT
jgi:hypothetical protein